MKILFATMQFGRGYSQGTERYLSLLSGALRAAGHETMFLAGDPERRGAVAALGQLVQDEPRVFAVPTRGWMSVRGEIEGYAALFERIRPDIVHVANPAHIGLGVLEAAREAGIPTVVSVVDFWWLCPKHTLHHHRGGVCRGDVTWRECMRCIAATHESGLLRLAANAPILGSLALPTLMARRSMARGLPDAELGAWIRRRELTIPALDGAGGVIFLSRTGESLLRPLLSRPRCERIQNGLEPSWFAPPDAPRRSKPARAEELRIGYAGALAPHKGVHTLLDAVRLLGWWRTELRIAAAAESSRYGRRLRRLSNGLRVEFVGRVAGERMPAFLDELDLLIVPSLCPENVPMIVLEAFARRTPVIASDMPGIAELMPDSSVLFKTGSAASLAACLKRWLESAQPTELPRVSSAAEMAERTLAVYEHVRGDGKSLGRR
jgi:glycosyltransferase involved in cell wall biosynthesis